MINELMQLAKSLPLNGVAMAEDKLMPLPKGKTFRVLLTAEGCISDVEVLDEERSATLRKYMPNKFKSFPGFNQLLIPSIDVWQARFEEENKQETESSQRQEVYKRPGIKEDPEKTKEGLYGETKEEFYGDKGLYKKAVKGIESNLIKFPKELRGMMETVILENETLARLLDALSRIKDGQGFLANVEKICYERNLKYDPRKPVSFFFDVDDYNEWPMAHQRSLTRLNEVLCKCENKETVTQKDADATGDAFGEPRAGADSLMRDISIPLLGLVKIRSSNKDIEALDRYHVTGGASFPMGKSARISAEGALKYVVDAENESSTYGRVSSREILRLYSRVSGKHTLKRCGGPS